MHHQAAADGGGDQIRYSGERKKLPPLPRIPRLGSPAARSPPSGSEEEEARGEQRKKVGCGEHRKKVAISIHLESPLGLVLKNKKKKGIVGEEIGQRRSKNGEFSSQKKGESFLLGKKTDVMILYDLGNHEGSHRGLAKC